MARGGFRANAGRPPGARNKPKATASPRPNARRLAKAQKLDSLQLTMTAARELYARGELAEAGRMAARAMPYTVQRYGIFKGDAPRSAEQKQLDFDFTPPPKPADEKAPDSWEGLLN